MFHTAMYGKRLLSRIAAHLAPLAIAAPAVWLHDKHTSKGLRRSEPSPWDFPDELKALIETTGE
jgi:hypothetical protein